MNNMDNYPEQWPCPIVHLSQTFTVKCSKCGKEAEYLYYCLGNEVLCPTCYAQLVKVKE